MTYQDYVQQAIELCDLEIARTDRIIAYYEKSIYEPTNTVAKISLDQAKRIRNLAFTHKAEFEEHEPTVIDGRNWCGCANGDEYPCPLIVTKAKRLLGVK